METKTVTTSRVNSNKELQKSISKVSHYDSERFSSDAKRYIKAIKEGRVICCIGSVSSSGMSRTIKFLECAKSSREKNKYYYQNFFAFFKAMEFSPVRDSDYFRINGCGMDMIFDSNYRIIHRLHGLGFLNSKDCAVLCQRTPSVI